MPPPGRVDTLPPLTEKGTAAGSSRSWALASGRTAAMTGSFSLKGVWQMAVSSVRREVGSQFAPSSAD